MVKKAKSKEKATKASSKKAAIKAIPKKKVHRSIAAGEKEPEYMIQISDPKMVRKDILESLREVIIFMQGYEKFRRIQEEKVTMFNQLKKDIKELNMLTGKLRKYLPQGKIQPAKEKPKRMMAKEEQEEMEEETPAETMPQETPEQNDLTELESQLSDIESELSKI
ncbi:MAG: hypothetical protein Q8R37_04860 [Nanoarchaeota archaeon]|nr:hypothetical protein [Nanoarchaeota archaeon]